MIWHESCQQSNYYCPFGVQHLSIVVSFLMWQVQSLDYLGPAGRKIITLGFLRSHSCHGGDNVPWTQHLCYSFLQWSYAAQHSLSALRGKWAMWQHGSSAQFQLLVTNINGAVKVPRQQCLCRVVTFQVQLPVVLVAPRCLLEWRTQGSTVPTKRNKGTSPELVATLSDKWLSKWISTGSSVKLISTEGV